MKLKTFVTASFAILSFLVSCSMKRPLANIGKISTKAKYDKNIEKDQVAIQIQLFDEKTKEKVSISDVPNLPGEVKDSTMNSKLFVFSKKNIPERIYIRKPGKGTMFVSPKFDYKTNNNLLIYKFYLFSAEKTNI